MLGKKMDAHQTRVFLVNTGWTVVPYGVGQRFDLPITRKIVSSVLNGVSEKLSYTEDKRFHIMVPDEFPGVPCDLLDPQQNWSDKTEYHKRADRLAKEFGESWQ